MAKGNPKGNPRNTSLITKSDLLFMREQLELFGYPIDSFVLQTDGKCIEITLAETIVIETEFLVRLHVHRLRYLITAIIDENDQGDLVPKLNIRIRRRQIQCGFREQEIDSKIEKMEE